MQAIVDPTANSSLEASLWWAVVLLLTVIGVAPEWTYFKLRRYYRPTDTEKLMEMDVVHRRYAQSKFELRNFVEKRVGQLPENTGDSRAAALAPSTQGLGDSKTSQNIGWASGSGMVSHHIKHGVSKSSSVLRVGALQEHTSEASSRSNFDHALHGSVQFANPRQITGTSFFFV
jgi:hypothetical protein